MARALQLRLETPFPTTPYLPDVAKFVVPYQGAEWFAAENSVLVLVYLLEHRALVEFRSPLQIAEQFLLGGI